MEVSKADLILHPVRLRILRTFAPPQRLTAQMIAARLPDVPPATLYRQLAILTRGGALAVVERRQVRGTTEKVYALLAGSTALTPDDLSTATKDDHLRYFTAFVAGLIADFGRYLEQGHGDLIADGVGYRQVPLYLSDEEFTRMVVDLNVVLAPLLGRGAGPGRRRRLLSTVVMPADDPAASVEGRTLS